MAIAYMKIAVGVSLGYLLRGSCEACFSQSCHAQLCIGLIAGHRARGPLGMGSGPLAESRGSPAGTSTESLGPPVPVEPGGFHACSATVPKGVKPSSKQRGADKRVALSMAVVCPYVPAAFKAYETKSLPMPRFRQPGFTQRA